MDNNALEKFCDQWLSSWTGGDPTELISFYSEDIFYLDPGNPNGIRGREQLLTYLAKLLRKFPDWIWSREELISSEKGFCLKWKATLNTGKTFYGLDILEIEDGRITRNEVFFDPIHLK